MTDSTGAESVTDSSIQSFINNAGKDLAFCYFTDKWAESGLKFPLDKANICVNNGAIPFIRLQNSEDPDGAPGTSGKYSHANIVNGKLDRELKQYALDLHNFPYYAILEYGTEINGNWFSWSDEGPEPFKKAFRYIYKIFADADSGVDMAFHCDATDNPDSAKWYPGDDVVGIVGTSCYGAETKLGCIKTLEQCYDNFVAISKTRPLAIFEWGLNSPTDTKDTLEQLPVKYPRIQLLQWWNEKVIPGHKEDSVPSAVLGENPAALTEYQKGIANPVYSDTFTSFS